MKLGRQLLPWRRWAGGKDSLAETWRRFKAAEKDPKYAAQLRAERERLRGLRAKADADAKSEAEFIQRRAAWLLKQAERTKERRQKRGLRTR